MMRVRVERLTDQAVVRRNHYLGGRYENIYVSLESIPELRVILDLATALAAHILMRPKNHLALGWWLNIMQPGERTFPHMHDDADELLSGAYYIDVPPGSGKLLLVRDNRRIEVETHTGMFVFFSPGVLHQVTRNESDRARISVGFNVGLAST
ncbi:MAG: 2OG-Fe(II) oxygenase family protein [Gammaproteobacteria bacterium]|nr:2OG-Fe(II) oxygenase family protein [Gammaproteobacteria bacterium]MDH5486155.1 2OG-Fe(II) oxygenase family protein [Gammaproteobacteria bacterium]